MLSLTQCRKVPDTDRSVLACGKVRWLRLKHLSCLLQTFWASSIEERAKVDLKFHFMKKTLNEVVRLYPCCAQRRDKFGNVQCSIVFAAWTVVVF